MRGERLGAAHAAAAGNDDRGFLDAHFGRRFIDFFLDGDRVRSCRSARCCTISPAPGRFVDGEDIGADRRDAVVAVLERARRDRRCRRASARRRRRGRRRPSISVTSALTPASTRAAKRDPTSRPIIVLATMTSAGPAARGDGFERVDLRIDAGLVERRHRRERGSRSSGYFFSVSATAARLRAGDDGVRLAAERVGDRARRARRFDRRAARRPILMFDKRDDVLHYSSFRLFEEIDDARAPSAPSAALTTRPFSRAGGVASVEQFGSARRRCRRRASRPRSATVERRGSSFFFAPMMPLSDG